MVGTGIGNVANAGNYEADHGKYYGRLTTKVEPSINHVNIQMDGVCDVNICMLTVSLTISRKTNAVTKRA